MKIRDISIFASLDDGELDTLEISGGIIERSYRRGERVFSAGDTPSSIGIVLSGGVRIETNDIWGDRTVMGIIEPGQVFGESYALCRETLAVDAVCAADSGILLLRVSALTHGETGIKLMRALLTACANKNLRLSARIFCTSPKTIRARVLTYLSSCALSKGSHTFTIPFDRQELADYLNVDRTALSKELGKLAREGKLSFRKNSFILNA